MSKMMKFVFPFLLGLPFFIDWRCFNFYPLCALDSGKMSPVVHCMSPFIFFFLISALSKGLLRNIDNLFIIILIVFLFFIITIFRPINNMFDVSVILLQMLPFSLFLLRFREFMNYAEISQISFVFLYASLIAAVSSLAVFASLGGDQFMASQIIYGYLNYWNDYTILLYGISVVMNSVSSSYTSGIKHENVWLIVFIVVFLSVCFSGSRASLLFIWFLFFGMPIANFKKFLMSIGCIALVSPVVLSNERIYVKLKRIITGDIYSGRDDIWGNAFQSFMNTPLFGIESSNISSLHSTFIELLFFVGVFWFFVIILISLLFFVNLYKVKHHLNDSFIVFLLLGFAFGPMAFNAPLRQIHIFLLVSYLIIFVKMIKSSKYQKIVTSRGLLTTDNITVSE